MCSGRRCHSPSRTGWLDRRPLSLSMFFYLSLSLCLCWSAKNCSGVRRCHSPSGGSSVDREKPCDGKHQLLKASLHVRSSFHNNRYTENLSPREELVVVPSPCEELVRQQLFIRVKKAPISKDGIIKPVD